MDADKSFQRKLEALRKEINRLDEELVRLLNERAEISRKIGKLKREHGQRVHDPKREAELLKWLEKKNRELGEKIPNDVLQGIYQKILHSSKKEQHRLIQGEGGWDWE